MSKIKITVTRPELTAGEKKERMEELKKATAEFMKAVVDCKTNSKTNVSEADKEKKKEKE